MFDEAPSVEYFCQRYVEVQGEESDHVHIVALSDALQVGPGLPRDRSRSHHGVVPIWDLLQV